jgi:hypothetical protein
MRRGTQWFILRFSCVPEKVDVNKKRRKSEVIFPSEVTERSQPKGVK